MNITMNDAVRGIEKLVADYGHIVYSEALNSDACDYTLPPDEFAADSPQKLGVPLIQVELGDWKGEVIVACAVGRVLYDQGFAIETLIDGSGSVLDLAGIHDEDRQNDPGKHNSYGSTWAAPTAESIEILALRFADIHARAVVVPGRMKWDIDKDAAVVLQCMQAAQDHGWSWAGSGQAALRTAELIEAARS